MATATVVPYDASSEKRRFMGIIRRGVAAKHTCKPGPIERPAYKGAAGAQPRPPGPQNQLRGELEGPPSQQPRPTEPPRIYHAPSGDRRLPRPAEAQPDGQPSNKAPRHSVHAGGPRGPSPTPPGSAFQAAVPSFSTPTSSRVTDAAAVSHNFGVRLMPLLPTPPRAP